MTRNIPDDRQLPSPVEALIRTVTEWKRKGLDRSDVEAEAAAIVGRLSATEQEALVDGALALLDSLYARIYAGDMGRRPKHKTVALSDPNGDLIDIDESIAPLIAAMWRNGWTTFNSCEDDGGWIWIEMPGSDAEHFLTVVASEARAEVASGALAACARRGHPYLLDDRDGWDLSASAHDLNATDEGERRGPTRSVLPDIAVTVGVRFPPHHLPEVTAVVAGTRSPSQGEPAR